MKMRYFDLIKSALFPDRHFEEADRSRIGLPFVLLPLTGYAQMTGMAGLGLPSLSRHGHQDAQIKEFCLNLNSA
jgi:hypothetical protein